MWELILVIAFSKIYVSILVIEKLQVVYFIYTYMCQY